jgi:hypothetical protein
MTRKRTLRLSGKITLAPIVQPDLGALQALFRVVFQKFSSRIR